MKRSNIALAMCLVVAVAVSVVSGCTAAKAEMIYGQCFSE